MVSSNNHLQSASISGGAARGPRDLGNSGYPHLARRRLRKMHVLEYLSKDDRLCVNESVNEFQ